MRVRVALSPVLLAVVLALLSACAGRAPSSPPSRAADFSAQARCERDGLFWHVNLGICEKI